MEGSNRNEMRNQLYLMITIKVKNTKNFAKKEQENTMNQLMKELLREKQKKLVEVQQENIHHLEMIKKNKYFRGKGRQVQNQIQQRWCTIQGLFLIKRWGTIQVTIIQNSLQKVIQEHSYSVIRIQLEDPPLRDLFRKFLINICFKTS